MEGPSHALGCHIEHVKRGEPVLGSAAIGIFAQQWHGHVDEVIVVDDHITGVLSEHQAGKCLDVPPTGIRVRGRRSTPGRYFQVAHPGTGWGGTDITDPLAATVAFQRRFRPELFDGTIDGETRAILLGLLLPQPEG